MFLTGVAAGLDDLHKKMKQMSQRSGQLTSAMGDDAFLDPNVFKIRSMYAQLRKSHDDPTTLTLLEKYAELLVKGGDDDDFWTWHDTVWLPMQASTAPTKPLPPLPATPTAAQERGREQAQDRAGGDSRRRHACPTPSCRSPQIDAASAQVGGMMAQPRLSSSLASISAGMPLSSTAAVLVELGLGPLGRGILVFDHDRFTVGADLGLGGQTVDQLRRLADGELAASLTLGEAEVVAAGGEVVAGGLHQRQQVRRLLLRCGRTRCLSETHGPLSCPQTTKLSRRSCTWNTFLTDTSASAAATIVVAASDVRSRRRPTRPQP